LENLVKQTTEHLLHATDRSLSDFPGFKNKLMKHTNRLEYFLSLGKESFSRKDYMSVFKDISTATASRDLRKGSEMGLFEKSGDKNVTTHNFSD
jgi:Fic family protein